MEMVLLNPNGIDENEVAGIDAFRRELSADWLGYANLELRDPSDPFRRQREIDVVIITHDKVLIVDLKNWHGKLLNQQGQWVLDGRLKTQSAELKLGKNAKKVASLLRLEMRVPYVPAVEHFVIFIPPDIDFSALPPAERSRCFTLEGFIECLTDGAKYRARFSKDQYWNDRRPFFKEKAALDRIFRIGRHFDPQKLWFADVYPLDTDAIFRHPKRVYDEFLVQRHDNADDLALLRLWDFSRLPAKAAAISYRRELAGRELDVLTRIRNEDYRLYEEGVLKSERRDEEVGIRYWELFRRSRTMAPWSEFLTRTKLTREDRLRFARLLISRVADLHRLGIAHTDVGDHAIWVDQYENRVMLTAFGAAHYPNTATVRDLREHLAASEIAVPEGSASELVDAPFRRDVFLVAALAWQIITGRPIETADGVPVILERDLDENASIPAELRTWFLKALAFAPEDRYESLEAGRREYNLAVDANLGDPAARRLSVYHVELEPHFKYPARNTRDVLRQGFSQVWKHTADDGTELVAKFWPHRGESLETNGPAILALFARIDIVRVKRPAWASPVREFGLCDTGVFIVQEYVEAPSIAEFVPKQASEVIEMAANLVSSIDDLHSVGLAHGDLKPEHIRIIRTGDHLQPILLDLFELSAPTQIPSNTAYYPPVSVPDGATIDRYAVCRLIAELCDHFGHLDPAFIAPLALAANQCGGPDIQWRSLAPLDAYLARHRKQQEKRRTITVTLAQEHVKSRMLDAHCGVFLITVRQNVAQLVGAREQLRVEIQGDRWDVRVTPTRPETLEAASRTPYRFKGDIQVRPGLVPDFSELQQLLETLKLVPIALHRKGLIDSSIVPDETQPVPASPSDAAAPHAVMVPTVDADQEVEPVVDVRSLWNALIAVQLERRPRVRVSGMPVFDDAYGGNVVEYNADEYKLEFSPEEIVRVFQGELLVGELDVRRSRSPGILVFRELWRPGAIRPGVELRLDSLQASTSLERRSAAVARILGNEAAIDDLISFFDPTSDLQPLQVDDFVPSPDDLDRYELNESQREAFMHLWRHRPVGLLQGPPGTGKSTFIAAFVHYALTRGRIRSALVLSQAHAAANAVGEKIRTVAEAVGEPVTMLRFGAPDNVSAELLPIHAGAIQNAYREVFLSNLEDRLITIGERLPLSKRYLYAAHRLESRLRGLLRPAVVGRDPDVAASSLQSEPLDRLLEQYEINPTTPVSLVRDLLHEAVAGQAGVRSPKAARQYRKLLELSWLWPDALRYGQRTLEEFLVRTRQVVVGTCNGSGRRKLGIDKKHFDLVIIDEAARCDPGDLAVAMQSGAWIVLVGDHKQLPPYVDDDIAPAVLDRLGLASKDSLLQSDFERIFRARYGKLVGRTLVEQYRMAPPIRALVSALYYQDTGLRDAKVRETTPPAYALLDEPFAAPLTWWDTTNMGDEAREVRSRDGSTTNALEARMIVHLLRRLEGSKAFWEKAPGDTSIGVICMYGAQERLVTDLVEAAGFDESFRNRIKIDTVDGYQGQENAIVLLSLVRNNDDGNIGFVRDERRANVALSRAKERLVIIGSASMYQELRRENEFGKVARYLRDVPGIGNRHLAASFGR